MAKTEPIDPYPVVFTMLVHGVTQEPVTQNWRAELTVGDKTYFGDVVILDTGIEMKLTFSGDWRIRQ